MPSLSLSASGTNFSLVEKNVLEGIVTASAQPMKIMLSSGLATRIGLDNFCGNIDHALERCTALLDKPS